MNRKKEEAVRLILNLTAFQIIMNYKKIKIIKKNSCKALSHLL